jgi:hypothetical protein
MSRTWCAVGRGAGDRASRERDGPQVPRVDRADRRYGWWAQGPGRRLALTMGCGRAARLLVQLGRQHCARSSSVANGPCSTRPALTSKEPESTRPPHGHGECRRAAARTLAQARRRMFIVCVLPGRSGPACQRGAFVTRVGHQFLDRMDRRGLPDHHRGSWAVPGDAGPYRTSQGPWHQRVRPPGRIQSERIEIAGPDGSNRSWATVGMIVAGPSDFDDADPRR